MFANLSQRGLFRAQLNALKAMDPSFDRAAQQATKLPLAAKDIGDGFQLRPRFDSVARQPTTAAELEALKQYLSGVWKQPFDAERDNSAIRRWARLVLPDVGQIARSKWGESAENRVTRMVKVSCVCCLCVVTGFSMQFASRLPEGFEVGEVQYYFKYDLEPNVSTALAMISVFGVPNRALLQDSLGTLWAARSCAAGMQVIPAKSILSVVAMVPFPAERGASEEVEGMFKGMDFLYEKMGAWRWCRFQGIDILSSVGQIRI
jgi:hypothetical protein